MQGGRDPFSGFGNPFGSFGGFGGFGGQRNLMNSFFGGRDPFDDPFFTSPFGSAIESGFFGSNGGPFMNPASSGFLEQQPHQFRSSGGPVIEELSSDDEEGGQERKDNPRKHGRSSNEPIVEHPDDETAEKKIKHMPRNSEISQFQQQRSRPQSHSFTFQSSSVSYGGANGNYYTSSRTRRSGSDGLTFEECKEADSSTGQARHRVSKGIHEKGHSVTRKLKSDGHVDTMQTLHNLNEDELVNFEEAWQGNARRNLTGLPRGFATGEIMGSGSISQQIPNRGGWALPSTERSNNQSNLRPPHVGVGTIGPLPTSPGRRINIDGSGSTQFRSNGSGYNNQMNNQRPPHVGVGIIGRPTNPGRRINIDGSGATQFGSNGTGNNNQMNNRF